MKIYRHDERVKNLLLTELHTYQTALKNASKHFQDEAEWKAFQESVEAYIIHRTNKVSQGKALQMGLSWRKVAELYDLRVNDLELLREVITSSKFYDYAVYKLRSEFAKEGLTTEGTEAFIEQESTIQYTKGQEKVLSALEGLEKALKEVYKLGGTPECFNVDRNGQVFPQVAFIKAYIK